MDPYLVLFQKEFESFEENLLYNPEGPMFEILTQNSIDKVNYKTDLKGEVAKKSYLLYGSAIKRGLGGERLLLRKIRSYVGLL